MISARSFALQSLTGGMLCSQSHSSMKGRARNLWSSTPRRNRACCLARIKRQCALLWFFIAAMLSSCGPLGAPLQPLGPPPEPPPTEETDSRQEEQVEKFNVFLDRAAYTALHSQGFFYFSPRFLPLARRGDAVFARSVRYTSFFERSTRLHDARGI